jgi:hypothetical protein
MPVTQSLPPVRHEKNGIRLPGPRLAGSNIPLEPSPAEKVLFVHNFVQLVKSVVHPDGLRRDGSSYPTCPRY